MATSTAPRNVNHSLVFIDETDCTLETYRTQTIDSHLLPLVPFGL